MPADSCRTELLQPLLEDRLSEREQAWLESHLAGCQKCRGDLERLAADTRDWKEVRDVLHQGPGSTPTRPRQLPEKGTPPTERDAKDSLALREVARYQVERWIGGGSFGEVYLCLDSALNRRVAVKVTRRDALPVGSDPETYLAEARALGQLDHPCIVPVHDAGQTADGLCFLVFKYLPGGNLREALAASKWDPIRVAEAIARVADALAHLHSQRMIHRDVKPSNVLLDEDSRTYLADFGLARTIDELRGPSFVGTVPYMSPEQARGEGHRIDHRSDVFSLGVVLFEALTGRRLFTGDKSTEIAARIAEFQPYSLRVVEPGIPPELDRICCRALSQLAADRFQSAGEMAKELRAWASRGEAEAAESTVTAVGESKPEVMPRGIHPFGADDAGFFADLLPGPRGADGAPESVRLWKNRLEGAEEQVGQPMAVGVLYGPSGAGKSSFVRAGVAPRLAPWVRCIQIECTADGTEAALARALEGLSRTASTSPLDGRPKPGRLAEQIAALRKSSPPGCQRVVLVFDQFERWLSSWDGGGAADLVAAMRQLDGRRVLAVLVVRDEFWTSTARLLRDLELPLADGRNAMAVEPFPLPHARRVLADFGRAYGVFPPSGNEAAGEKFLDAVLAGLAVDGRVVPAQLALLADLMKESPWTVAELQSRGGVHGVLRRFLDDAFGPTAHKPQRRLAAPAQAVLEELLPDAAAAVGLAGTPKTSVELRDASGLAGRPEDFEELTTLLEERLRLVARIDGEAGDSPRYVLSHDTLVRPVREWLDAERGRTWRGRAQLKLKRLAAAYAMQPEARNLPTWWEWVALLAAAPSTTGIPGAESLLRAARRRYALRLAAGMAAVLGLSFAAWEFHGRIRAAASLDGLLSADAAAVPQAIERLRPWTRWIAPPPPAGPLDSTGPGGNEDWVRYLIDAEKAVPRLVANSLGWSRAELAAYLPILAERRVVVSKEAWSRLSTATSTPSGRLRLACILARVDPADPRWNEIAQDVVYACTLDDSMDSEEWASFLRPVREQLFPQFLAVFEKKERGTPARIAATFLAEHWREDPTRLLPLILAADGEQLGRLLRPAARIAPAIRKELGDACRPPKPGSSSEARVAVSRRRANAAAVLLAAGDDEAFDAVVGDDLDPTARARLHVDAVAMRIDESMLTRRLRTDSSSTFGRLLCLGRLVDRELPPAVALRLTEELQKLYQAHPDPGVHSACEWLMRKLNRLDAVQAIDRRLAGKTMPKGFRWFVNAAGVTFAVFGPNVAYRFGADPKHHVFDADARTAGIGRRFAVATKLATAESFQHVRCEHQTTEHLCPTPQHPVDCVTLVPAARYCELLSAADGMPESQRCFPKAAQFVVEEDVVPALGFVARTGCRLPTEEELEYVQRAGSETTTSFGADPSLAEWFETFGASPRHAPSPPGLLPPNAAGMFDPHGNLLQPTMSETFGARVDGLPTTYLRGSCFQFSATTIRSVQRWLIHLGRDKNMSSDKTGLRVARTLRDADEVSLND